MTESVYLYSLVCDNTRVGGALRDSRKPRARRCSAPSHTASLHRAHGCVVCLYIHTRARARFMYAFFRARAASCGARIIRIVSLYSRGVGATQSRLYYAGEVIRLSHPPRARERERKLRQRVQEAPGREKARKRFSSRAYTWRASERVCDVSGSSSEVIRWRGRERERKSRWVGEVCFVLVLLLFMTFY